MIEAIKTQRLVWVIGGIISLLPSLIIGLVKFCIIDASWDTIIKTISSTSIMYTGVTLMISAINDLEFTSENKAVNHNVHRSIIIYLVLLLLFVMLYISTEVFLSFADSTSNMKKILATAFVVISNFVFVFVPYKIGWNQYTQSIERATQSL